MESKNLLVLKVAEYDFADWERNSARALKLVVRAVNAQQKPKFKSALWSVLKEHLRDLFGDTCAYCQAYFSHVAFGDVEHFRPKGAVAEEKKHPGYYWLAYEPTNYLPSCQICNTVGKGNCFPISGERAWAPDGNIGKENPLLLHPRTDNPREYLVFSPSLAKNAGWAMPLQAKDKGEHSIKSYDLNRDELVQMRKREQEYTRLAFKSAFSEEKPSKITDLIESCLTGHRPFAQAAIDEIEDYCKTMGIKSFF